LTGCLGKREAVGDLQALVYHQTEQGALGEVHVARLLMAVLHHLHDGLQGKVIVVIMFQNQLATDNYLHLNRGVESRYISDFLLIVSLKKTFD